ncbi:MAG: M23 family metallopeptidase, partial [Acidobacteria bacterium]|nr:M23 family metallopeptidase [Acidobacteriota bacterium]
SVDEAVQQEEVALQAEDAREQQQVQPADPPPVESKIGKNQNFTAALQQAGFDSEDANAITTAAQRVFNLRQVRAGNTMTINRSAAGELRELNYRIDPDRMLTITPEPEGKFSAEVKPVPSKTEVSTVTGQINDSLFKAVAQSGESPELAMRLAQIFAYDLDFYTDARKGDTFRMILEKKKYADGKTAGYGKILAAEYDNKDKKYQALLFHDDAGHPGYYSADGKPLQRAFLHSPLKFSATVTSHFSKSRYHPILKLFRPHMGTDYGAPVGTPVQTIGAGRVEFAGRKGGEGNMVQIAHSDGYETMYLHLSRMFVHQGERVEIGKTIGLVGSTGLSTGPHLDFRILQRGQYKNFEKLGLPPSDPIAKKNWPEFTLVRQQWLPVLRGELAPQQASDGSARGASASSSPATSSPAKPADTSSTGSAAGDPPSR